MYEAVTWLFQPVPVSTVPNTGRNLSNSIYRGLDEAVTYDDVVDGVSLGRLLLPLAMVFNLVHPQHTLLLEDPLRQGDGKVLVARLLVSVYRNEGFRCDAHQVTTLIHLVGLCVHAEYGGNRRAADFNVN